MNIIQKFLILLSKHERKNALLLLLLILVMAFLDMIGVASILPFMAVLTNPSIVETNVILNNIYCFMFGCLPRIKNLRTIMQYNYVYILFL